MHIFTARASTEIILNQVWYDTKIGFINGEIKIWQVSGLSYHKKTKNWKIRKRTENNNTWDKVWVIVSEDRLALWDQTVPWDEPVPWEEGSVW